MNKIKDANEIMYQAWKNSCKLNIESMSLALDIPKLYLVKFAYKHRHNDFKKNKWMKRLNKELKIEYAK